jgi:hypothetical protein
MSTYIVSHRTDNPSVRRILWGSNSWNLTYMGNYNVQTGKFMPKYSQSYTVEQQIEFLQLLLDRIITGI